MFDVLSETTPSSDSQSAFADSRSILDTKSLFPARQQEERNHGGRTLMSEVEEDDRIDLRLGLSLGGSFPKMMKTNLVKPSGLYPPLGNEFSNFPAEAAVSLRRVKVHGEVATVDQALTAEIQVLNPPLAWKEEQTKYEGPAHHSREQVWQALQKNGAEPAQLSMHVEVKQELKDASASLSSNRRSASVQPTQEDNEEAPQSIKRSSSNGLPMNGMPQLESASAPLSRQVSSVESLLEKNPETPMPTSCQQQQEALELQRKKELQALRRQEARKRRKSLIEEKYQKKAKKDDRGFLPQTRNCLSNSSQKNSSASLTSQDASCFDSQNSVLERLGSKQWALSTEKSLSVVVWAECDNERGGGSAQAEGDRSCPVAGKVGKAGAARKERRSRGTEKAEESVVEMEMERSDSKADLSNGELGHGVILRAPKTPIRPCDPIQVAPTTLPSAPHKESAVVQKTQWNMSKDANEDIRGKDANEDTRVKACRSSCSETESGDTKEHSSVQNECGEPEASSRKSASDTIVGTGSCLFPSMVMANNSLAYPPPFPVLPIPYPFPVPGGAPAAMPLPMCFPFPCFMQYPVPAGGESSAPTSSQLPGSFQIPVSSGLTSYHFSVPDGSFPWFPVVSSGEAAQLTGPVLVNNSSNNECDTECLQDEENSEKPSTAPLGRTSSTCNSRGQIAAESLPTTNQSLPSMNRPVDVQAPVVATETSLARAPSDKQHDRKKENLTRKLTERHQSLALPKVPQESGVVEQPSSSMHVEGVILQQKGIESRSTNSQEVGSSKSVRLGLKQEEEHVDNQLASESSAQEVSNVQAGVVDKQKSGSFSDLPWVSTTGVGPNGKTISGVMYISDKRQARLICSCHGKNMSPAEFVQHSGRTDLSNPERNIVVNPFPFINQLATAPV